MARGDGAVYDGAVYVVVKCGEPGCGLGDSNRMAIARKGGVYSRETHEIATMSSLKDKPYEDNLGVACTEVYITWKATSFEPTGHW